MEHLCSSSHSSQFWKIPASDFVRKSKTARYCSEGSLRFRSASGNISIGVLAIFAGRCRAKWSVRSGKLKRDGQCFLPRRNEDGTRMCLEPRLGWGPTRHSEDGTDWNLEHDASYSNLPCSRTCSKSWGVVHKRSVVLLLCLKERRTNMNMAGSLLWARVWHTAVGVCGAFVFQPWTHRQHCQNRRLVEERHATRGETTGPWLPRTRVQRHLQHAIVWDKYTKFEQNLLLTMSSKLSIEPFALYTSYKRGTWISQRTLCENSLLLTIHLASLSHSFEDLPYTLSRHSTFYSRT